jgi:hypothetical protein
MPSGLTIEGPGEGSSGEGEVISSWRESGGRGRGGRDSGGGRWTGGCYRHPLDFRAFVKKAYIDGKLYYDRARSPLFRDIPIL